METYEADIDVDDSMVSASSYLQPPPPQQPSQLWATLTKQEEEIGELAQEDEDDEIDELAVDDGKPWHPSTLSLYTCSPYFPITCGPWKGWQWALCQRNYSVSSWTISIPEVRCLAGPRTISTPVMILEIVRLLR
jgi:hypothetical protein